MPTFQYTALTQQGQEIHGWLEAADVRAAAAALRRQALFVVELAAGPALPPDASTTLPAGRTAERPQFRWIGWILPVTTQDRVLFLRQLALMLRTGLTLLQGLDICAEQTIKPRWAASIRGISAAVRSGKRLSEAIASRRQFPNLIAKLVYSAEASGELDATLERAALYLERRDELRARLATSLTYPSIVVVTSFAVAGFLVTKVIPKFAVFFARRGVALPWATQMLLDLSAWMLRYGPRLAATVLVVAVAVALAYMSRRGRLVLDRWLLYVPLIGGLLTTGAMAQFSQTLSMLLTSGLTVLESLRMTADVLGNRAISDCVARSSDHILRGQDLANSLREPVIPPLVRQVVSVGERTGALGQVLGELADFYDKQLQARIRRMTAIIEPVMILLVGGMVGFVYFAFFQAVLQLATAGR